MQKKQRAFKIEAMKTKLLTLLIYLPTILIGQDWAPIGAKWIYDHDYGLPPYLTSIESVKDTLILNKSCKLLITKQINEVLRENGTYYWDTITISKDYIYKSNDTIFHFNQNENTFYPLYLMNVKVHDTILVREKVSQCDYIDFFCSRFEYFIDSITNISLQGHDLKVIYNSETKTSNWVFNRSWNYDKYPIIEKLGSLKYFFGVSRNMVMEGGLRCLRCYTDNEISFKADYWTQDCEYKRPLNGPSSVIKLSNNEMLLWPNPFDNYIKINADKPIEFEIFDSFGRILIKGIGNNINVSALQYGTYFIKIKIDKKEIITRKIIK